MPNLLLVMLGGAIGAGLRCLVGGPPAGARLGMRVREVAAGYAAPFAASSVMMPFTGLWLVRAAA
ncbi:MAG TPA: hypothetical protein VGW34_12530 [Allosphingosinicella sp.]|nr:hypothetical protein [Allosphingosinicella sp.]